MNSLFHNIPAFSSRHLAAARDVTVLLPPGYDDSTKKYPTLYLNDGEYFFRDNSPAHQDRIEIDVVSRLLARTGRITPPIIVAVSATSNRHAEYSPALDGPRYIRFLTTELKPFIDANFRTSPLSSDTATLGFSLGALMALFTVRSQPEVFGMAACLSTCWFDFPGTTLKDLRLVSYFDLYEKRDFPLGTRLYFDSGTREAHDPTQIGMIEMQHEIVAMLRQRGFRTDHDLQALIIEGSDHSIAAWNARIYRPLLFLFGTQTSSSAQPQEQP